MLRAKHFSILARYIYQKKSKKTNFMGADLIHFCLFLSQIEKHSRPSPLFENCSIESETITSSTAQGGGGSFKNRKRIGEIDCCE